MTWHFDESTISIPDLPDLSNISGILARLQDIVTHDKKIKQIELHPLPRDDIVGLNLDTCVPPLDVCMSQNVYLSKNVSKLIPAVVASQTVSKTVSR
jgi:hypothetical protein